MVIPIQLPNGQRINFPDDTSPEEMYSLTMEYARQEGMLDPGFAKTFGAGVDTLQSQMAALPIGVLDTLQDKADTQEEYDTYSEWRKIFEDIRTTNKEEAAQVAQDLTDVQDITKSPGTVVKQQVAFQLPQMVGLIGASMVPGGQVVGPATALTYFTASNVDRQLEEGMKPDLIKAAGFGSGQAAAETALLMTLKGIPGGTFAQGLTKAAAVGVGGEVIQQALERASADLDLMDDKAKNEYIDSAIGAGIFVGAGAPITYMATNRGDLIPVSEKIKEKLSKGEQPRAEEIVEEQIRSAPGTVDLGALDPDGTIGLKWEDYSEKSDQILESAGLDSSYFKTPEEKTKAASVVLRNITDAEVTEARRQELAKAGVDPQKILDYKQENPKKFFEYPIEEVFSEIENITPEEAQKRLEPVRNEFTQIQKQATELATGLDPSLDEDVNKIQTTLDELMEDVGQIQDYLRPIPRTLKPQDPLDIPKWLKKPNAEGVRRTLSIKPTEKTKTLMKGVEDSGYLSFIKEDKNIEKPKIADIAKEEVGTKKKPVKGVAKVFDTAKNDLGLENTFNEFAKTQADLLNYKRQRNPQPPQAQIKQGVIESSVREDIQPYADKIDIKPETIPFVDQVLRNAARKLGGIGKGVNVDSVWSNVSTDPVYKIQYSNFLKTTINPEDATPNQTVEQFFYVFDHTKALSAVDKRRLEREFPRIYKTVHNYFGIDAPTKNMIVGPEAQKELLANIYQEMVSGNKEVLKGLSVPTKAVFRKVDSFVKEVRKELGRQKVFSQPQLFGPEDIDLNELRIKRLEAINDETLAQNYHKAILDSEELANDDIFKSDVDELVGDAKFNKWVYRWVSNAASLHAMGRQDPVAAQVLKVVDFRDIERAQNAAKLRSYGFQLQALEKSNGVGFAEQITERIHRLEEMGGSYDLSTPGQVTLIDEKGSPVGIIRGDAAHQGFSLIDAYKQETLNQEDASLRARLKDFGIYNENATLEEIQKTITLAEGNNNVVRATNPENAKIVDNKLDRLKELLKRLKQVESLRTKAYFPRTRTGRLGLVVKAKNSDKRVFFAQFDSESGIKTDGPNKAQLKEILAEIKAKYPSQDYEIFGLNGRTYDIDSVTENNYVPINLTRNDEIKRHNINSLISAFELIDDMGGLTENKERANDIKNTFELRAEGNFGYFGRRDFIDGYIKDPFKAIELSSKRFASAAAAQKYTGKLDAMRKQLEKYKDNSARVKAILERLDYINNPEESWAWLKSFNYQFAMGGSIKSAAIQLLNLFTNGQGYMDRLNGSPLANKKRVVKAVLEANKFFQRTDGDVLPTFNINNPEEISKAVRSISSDYLTPEQKKMLEPLIPTRFFESVIEQVHLEGQEAISKKFSQSSLFRKTMTKVDNALKPLNKMVAITESVGRLANQISYTQMFTKEPASLAKFEQVFGREPKWQLYKDEFTKRGMDLPTTAALYMTDEVFFITGSTGKSKLATVGELNILSPFSNFAIQATSGLKWMWQRDPKAFALTMMYYTMLGGLAGVPFFSNLNELVKFLFKQLGLGTVDLELEIRERLFDMTNSPEVAELITGGLPNLASVDLSGSVTQQLPYFNEVLKFFDPDTKASEIASLTGSYALSLGKGLGEILSAAKDPYKDFDVSSFLEAVIPYKGARDLTKAYNAATQPIVTRRGQPLLPTQEDDPLFLLLTAAGFQPSELSRARDRYYFEQIESENPAMIQIRTQRNNLWKEYYMADTPEKKSEIKSRLRLNVKEAQKEAFNQGVNFSLSRYMNDGRSKGMELASGNRNIKRLPKNIRKNTERYKEMFMVE